MKRSPDIEDLMRESAAALERSDLVFTAATIGSSGAAGGLRR